MKIKNLIIHIGFPKTGTTTFQQDVFPNLKEYIYLNDHISSSFLQRLFYSRESSFRLNSKSIHDELQEIIKKFGTEKLYLLSNESFTSYGMFFRTYPELNSYTVDPNTIANKLHNAFFESNYFENISILVTLRNQLDLIKSMYAQTYNRFFKKYKQTNNFRRFIDYSLTYPENMIIDTLQYDCVIRKYQDLFGEINVHVFLFEELLNKPAEFCSKISLPLMVEPEIIYGFISSKDKKNNKTLGQNMYLTDKVSLNSKIMLIRKKVLRNKQFGLSGSRIFNFLDKFYFGKKKLNNVSYSVEQQYELSNVFQNGNSNLEIRMGLPLKDFGYPTIKKTV